MLIIDEIHHVCAGPTLRQRSFLNVIKFLGNELHIPIVVAGTHDAFNTIQTDPQLANRFEPAPLPRWTMNEDYLRLLASFEVGLGLEQASHFIEPASDEDFGALGRHDREDFGVAQPGGDGGDRARRRTHHKRRA